ncbi:MAG: transposase [Actinomycetota bacterium]
MATKKRPRRYSAAEKETALALYVDVGPKEAARRTGIAQGTIASWARRAGVKTRTTSKAQAATEAAAAKAEQLRAELRIKLLEKANEALDLMDKPHIDFRGKDAQEVQFPRASPTGYREYAVTVGILLDKFRLENGESTDRKAIAHTGDVTLKQVPDDQLNDALARILAQLGQGSS